MIALQNEGAFDLADVKVAFRAKNKLVALKARMRHPDGKWEEIDARNLLSDSTSGGERDLNAQFFRFPRVQVGSVLEYYWVIEAKGLWWSDAQESVGKYPVRRYRYELEAAKPILITISSYNTQLPIKNEVLPNKNRRFTVDIHDIPHRPNEDYKPQWTFTEPYWMWRIEAFDWGTQVRHAYHTWNERLEREGERLFGLEGDLFAGWVGPRLGPCADVACTVAEARKWLRSATAPKFGANSLECRPLKEALSAKRANSCERTAMLRRVLADAGLQTRLAYATAAWSTQRDPNFPSLVHFNQMLVHLPAQDGLPKGAWLLPDCDHCGLNQLPTPYWGAEVLAFDVSRPGPSGLTQVRSAWVSTKDAERVTGYATRLTHAARLDGAGTLTDDLREVRSGWGAQLEAQKRARQTPTEVTRELENWANETSALTRVVAPGPRACDETAGSCVKEVRFQTPAYATAEGNARWLVPLNALSSGYDAHLTKDKAQRVAQALHFEVDDRFDEVLEVEAPPGFVLEAAAKPVTVRTRLVEANVTVEATPKGARVTRSLKLELGAASMSEYDDVQRAFRAFQDARNTVLAFVKR